MEPEQKEGRRPMELSNEQVIALFRELGKIDAKVEALSKPGAVCAVHGSRLDGVDRRFEDFQSSVAEALAKLEKSHGDKIKTLEAQQGKQNVVAASLGAIAAGLVLALKYLMTTR